MIYLRSHPRIPPAVVSRPEFHVADGGLGEDHPDLGGLVVQGVEEHVLLGVDKRPERLGVLVEPVCPPFLVRIVEKRAKQTGVQMVQDECKEVFVELAKEKGLWGY